MISKIIQWLCLLCLVANFSLGYNYPELLKRKKPLLKVRKYGPYISAEQGRYRAFGAGAEMQFKKVRFKKPFTHAFNLGFDYNFRFKEPVLGYNLGYWFKYGRFNVTYGVNAVFKSNFNQNRVGIGPAFGIKLLGFHLQTGYNFLTRNSSFQNVNQLYISLRYVLVNTRDYKWRKWKKR